MAEASAAEAAMFAVADESAGGVTMTVAGGVMVVVEGVAGVVMTVSSFLLQAAKDSAAIIETNRRAFFILVPQNQKGVKQLLEIGGNPPCAESQRSKTVKNVSFQRPAFNYRRIRGFP